VDNRNVAVVCAWRLLEVFSEFEESVPTLCKITITEHQRLEIWARWIWDKSPNNKKNSAGVLVPETTHIMYRIC
jgi:hypothetical protein